MRPTDPTFGLQLCTECRYAVAQNPLLKQGPTECRRNPPTVVPIQTGQGIGAAAMYPPVQKGMSCGKGLPRITMVGEAMAVPALTAAAPINGGEAA